MKCKFCGCDDEHPCFIPPNFIDGAVAGVLCAWLLVDVCTAPECVEQAYAEARPLADTIQFAIDLGLSEEVA